MSEGRLRMLAKLKDRSAVMGLRRSTFTIRSLSIVERVRDSAGDFEGSGSDCCFSGRGRVWRARGLLREGPKVGQDSRLDKTVGKVAKGGRIGCCRQEVEEW